MIMHFNKKSRNINLINPERLTIFFLNRKVYKKSIFPIIKGNIDLCKVKEGKFK
jgi:hypothetical protein